MQDGGSADLSRWLRAARRGEDCVLYLTDLCIPGRLSSLRQVTLPLSAVTDALDGGDAQINLGGAFVALKGQGESVRIEFRGEGDVYPTVAEVPTSELRSALSEA
ncbi:hypothetical protein BH11ARM2_BH11ARM2_08690 [soil metagenome]